MYVDELWQSKFLSCEVTTAFFLSVVQLWGLNACEVKRDVKVWSGLKYM